MPLSAPIPFRRQLLILAVAGTSALGTVTLASDLFPSEELTLTPQPQDIQYLMQVANPADKQKEMQKSSSETPTQLQPVEMVPKRLPSYEMPAVDVVGDKATNRDEEKIGPYAQPRWTARRAFPGTRIYVRPPGTVEFEYWLRPTITKDGDTEIRTLYEIGIGFEPRLQIDFYFRQDQDGDDSEILNGSQLELRYAFADWGKIWGNPTVYVEWVGLEERPDKFEAKLLLGGELKPLWHWGANLVGEFELGGEREYEYQLTGGVSYTVADSKFNLGLETQYIISDTKDNRGSYDTVCYVGPSLQWFPLPQLRINFSPLVGVTPDSGDFRAFLNVGWEF